MPYFGAISRSNLISALHKAGFQGPYTGKRHQFMEKNGLRVRLGASQFCQNINTIQ